MKTALIVDDDALARRYRATSLSAAGFSIHEAANGLEALELASRLSFDLVVSTIHMPMMDGLEMTRILRREESTRTIPVALVDVGATVDLRTRVEVLLAGANLYLEGNLSVEMLQRIARLLGGVATA